MTYLEPASRTHVVEFVRNEMLPFLLTNLKARNPEETSIWLEESDIMTAALALWIHKGMPVDQSPYLNDLLQRTGYQNPA